MAKLLIEIVENTAHLRQLSLGSESGGMGALVSYLGPEKFRDAVTQLESLIHLRWCIDTPLGSEPPQYPANLHTLHILGNHLNFMPVPITELFKQVALADLRCLHTLVITDYNCGGTENEDFDTEGNSDAQPDSAITLNRVHKLVLVGCDASSLTYSTLMEIFSNLNTLCISRSWIENDVGVVSRRIHQLNLVDVSDEPFNACEPDWLTWISTTSRSPDAGPCFFPNACDSSGLVGLTMRLHTIDVEALKEGWVDMPVEVSWLELESIDCGLGSVLLHMVSPLATSTIIRPLTTECRGEIFEKARSRRSIPNCHVCPSLVFGPI